MSLNVMPPLDRFIQDNSIKLERLRNAIAVSDKAISRGESQVFNSVEELDAFFDQL